MMNRPPALRATVLLLALALLLPAASAFADDEAKAIEKAVVAGYVDGIHRNGDPEAIRKGLHEKFVMSILRDGEISQVGRDEWIERIVEGKAKRPADYKAPEITYEFKLLDRSGKAGVARIDLHRDGVHQFTDYMAVYQFEDGWKIVGKTFQSHR